MAKTKESDLLKEALIEAKQVREIALSNAKQQLTEAFTPKMQAMISKQIQEDAEKESDEDENKMEEKFDNPDPAHNPGDKSTDAMSAAAESDKDRIKESDGYTQAAAGKDTDHFAKEKVNEDEKVDVDGKDEDDKDLDLESIIRELDTNDESQEDEESHEDDEMYEDEKVSDENEITATKERGVVSEDDEKESDEEDKEYDLNEIIQSLKEDESQEELTDEREGEKKQMATEDVDVDIEDEKDEDLKESDGYTQKAAEKDPDHFAKKQLAESLKASQKRLKESYSVINKLRTKLNEVNVLNSKLLFVNKLFKSFNLTNEQKIKVVENFDRAANLRECKLVFATLAESFKKTPSLKKLTEGKSFASDITGTTKPKKDVIIEENNGVNRWMELANIKTKQQNKKETK